MIDSIKSFNVQIRINTEGRIEKVLRSDHLMDDVSKSIPAYPYYNLAPSMVEWVLEDNDKFMIRLVMESKEN